MQFSSKSSDYIYAIIYIDNENIQQRCRQILIFSF